MPAAYYQPAIQRFLALEGLIFDLDKTMTHIRNKGYDDGAPRHVIEDMLSIVNEVMIGAIYNEEEQIPLWSENIYVTLGWFLRVHGQTSGNSFFQPIDIMSDEESMDDRSDSPTGVADIWPSDESYGEPEDLDGGITDEDMQAAFYVLEMMHADIGEFDVEVEDI